MVRTAAILVAVACLLAGCSAAPQRGSTTGGGVTVTPAPVPVTANASSASRRLAPGITQSGIVDPIALSEAHERALDGRPYIQTANLTVRNASGVVTTRRSFVTRVSASHRLKHTIIRADGPNAPFFGTDGATAIWSVGSQQFQAVDGPNGTRYRELSPWESVQPSLIAPPGGAVFLVASAVETNVSNRTAGPDLEVTGRRLESAALLASAAGVSDPQRPVLRATVRPDGLVRSYRLRFSASAGNRPVTVRIAVRYTRVGNPAIGPPPTPVNLTG